MTPNKKKVGPKFIETPPISIPRAVLRPTDPVPLAVIGTKAFGVALADAITRVR